MNKLKVCDHKKSYKVSEYEKASLYECKKCRLIFSDKYRRKLNLKALYKNYYRNEIVERFLFGVEYVVRAFRFFRAFKLYTIKPSAKSILDIGSGRGFLLYFLKRYYGYKTAVGTQIEEDSYKFSREELGLEIYNKDLLKLSFANRKFDLVTVWHVLEHVKEPEKYIIKIKSLLKKRGVLVIEVPNYNSWTRRFAGRYWLGLDLDYHLYFFTKDCLVSLLTKYGFKVTKTQTFSLEYSAFVSSQSIVSFITQTDHLFFSWLQTGRFRPAILFHLILFAFFFPLCLLVNLVLYPTDYGEVLLVVAEK